MKRPLILRHAIRSAGGGAGLALVGAMAAVWACGPDFPTPVLSHRRQALLATPYRSFAEEAAHLVAKPGDTLTAHEEYGDNTPTVEARDLTPGEARLVQAMRQSATGDAAYAAGEGLPAAIRLYTAGAVDFRAAVPEPDEPDAHADPARLPAAIGRFEAVLALPPAQAAARATWASFMLGRAHRLAGDAASTALARADFERTRALALGGAPDPLGLAVASYGEQARALLQAGDYAGAIDLYGEQAARGSRSGQDSLREIARDLLAHEATLVSQLKHPQVRRLMVSHALEVLESDSGAQETDATDTPAAPSPVDPATRAHAFAVSALLGAIERANLTSVEGLDEVAALAYAAGRYDLAGRCAQRAPTALGEIVTAKLALRRGDRDAALRGYDAVVARLRTRDADALEPGQARAIDAQHGVLKVARGDYAGALRAFVAAGGEYWFDAAYVAERVLTTAELAALVDSLPAGAPAKAADGASVNSDPDYRRHEPPLQLRLLLARRLMREGRYAQAYPYFAGAAVTEQDGKPAVSLEVLARRYGQALEDGAHKRTAIERAQALYAAAGLARHRGMELLGYELGPDGTVFDGSFDYDPTPAPASDGYAGPDEQARVQRTAPVNLPRLHYRATAVELATRAADQLPHRSQAFAAVLCEAAGWTRDGPVADHDRELALYRRYRHEGPHVRWAVNFGRQCQAPDFAAAQTLERHERWLKFRHSLRPYKRPLTGVAALLLVAVAVLAVRRARRGVMPPAP